GSRFSLVTYEPFKATAYHGSSVRHESTAATPLGGTLMDRDTRIATRNVERDAGRDARLDPDLERDIGLSDEQDGAPTTDDGRRSTDRDPREDVYPAPFAGVEVVGDGPVDLERDEEVVEDAQRLARAERDDT